MAFTYVLYEKMAHIVKITLNNPEKRNSLSGQLLSDLVAALQTADHDEEVRAIVLTGNGRAFCAGGDMNNFVENFSKSAPQLYEEKRLGVELYKLGMKMRTPIIAAVNGAAMGGGCGLAAMCHIAVASEEARFGTTEIRLGLIPFVILPWIKRAVGERKAMEMMLTGRVMTAPEAKEMGLVHHVVPHDELEQTAQEIAKKVAGYSPLAIELGLEAFYKTNQMDMDTAFDFLSTLRIVSFLSEDLKEGATAFLEKREPQWKGK